MKQFISFSILFVLLALICSCTKKKESLFKVEEISPWCILVFDSLDRSPTERIAMLKELGIKKYGYNWREKHLDETQEEFKLAKENNIEIVSTLIWLNAKRDSLGKLSPRNQKMLSNLKAVEYKSTIWVSFSDNFFKDKTQEQSMSIAIDMIKFVKTQTDALGCNLALYNHNGWFGNPYHQVEIIKQLKQESLTMVYNFHHAHEYVDDFPNIAKTITPYLSHVNLNGVEKEGEKILTIGEGDHELEMVKLLLEEGYKGSWGILGHIKTEDVHKVLKRNIAGLKSLNAKLEKEIK